MNSKLKNKWNYPIICFIIFFIVIIILFIQFCYLGLSKNVYGINMQEFAASRNTVTSVLTAKRGTIYDIGGNVLAQNISSYTLIAHLDPSRTINDNDPKHVVDKEYTASKLSTILGEENYDYILKRLNKTSKQVEFGIVGKNLTELTKLAIEELNLPGISFIETVKRYYPNGNFASYIVGYSKQYTRINIKVGESYDLYDYYKSYFNNYDNVTLTILNEKIISLNDKVITGLRKGITTLFIKSGKDPLDTIVINVTDYDSYKTMDSTIVGELGIENNYDDKLQGVDGFIKYQQDKYGYKIPDTPEEKKEPDDGYDIYLTIDSNIQRFAENGISEISSKYNPKWAIISVMDAQNGEILASATNPSYNPNNLPSNMNYNNPLVSYVYEPGSVMKIYTYMCAIETGLYDGNKTYRSGYYVFNDGTVMRDWNKEGWGSITYDVGFSYSSNVAIINIIKDYLSPIKLKTCLENYGFGKKTDVGLSNELNGKISFKQETEIMAAGFGQGISTTPVQQLQALTIVANNGVMVKPHIIKKIVNPNTNEEVITKIEKSEKIVSDKTISKIKDLMDNVISVDSATGKKYYLEGYDLIGKTGTAQIYENGRYLDGDNDYVFSVAIMYPKDNPEIIIYAAVKQPEYDGNSVLPEIIKQLILNISKYKGMVKSENNLESQKYKVPTYINNNVNEIIKQLESKKVNLIVIGDGDKIIKQYPLKNYSIIENDKVFLLTNGSKIIMPNIINWSKLDVMKLCEFMDIECTFNGYGYAVTQSIEEGTQIDKNSKLEITLENQIKVD